MSQANKKFTSSKTGSTRALGKKTVRAWGSNGYEETPVEDVVYFPRFPARINGDGNTPATPALNRFLSRSGDLDVPVKIIEVVPADGVRKYLCAVVELACGDKRSVAFLEPSDVNDPYLSKIPGADKQHLISLLEEVAAGN